MATLITGYNPQYSQNASVLTGNPDRVTVEVEDSIDKEFWEDLLTELCPQKDFHFDPYHTILKGDGYQQNGKGKSHIIKASPEFNEWHIGCVDSDYDWLLSDITEYGKIISACKFLLQTYAYSIENLMCLSSALSDLCHEATKEETEFDFDAYIGRLSQIIYPLLSWSVYLFSKGNQDFTPTDWRLMMVSRNSGERITLEVIEQRVREKLEEINDKHASEVSEFQAMTQTLSIKKMMTTENAYLFVRGHELFDWLAYNLLRDIIASLRKKHFDNLKESNMDKNEREVALQVYQKQVVSVKKSLEKNFHYKNKTPIYDKIKHDVSMIWHN